MPQLTQDLLEQLKEGYLAQLPGRINEIEQLVLKLENPEYHKEAYETLYRQIHSLKGSAGTYGFGIISSVCHQFEDFLGTVEFGGLPGKPINIDIPLAYIDLLRDVLDSIFEGCGEFPLVEKALSDIKRRLAPDCAIGLLVETSLLNVSIIRESLQGYPVQFSVAEDGITALHRLMTESFDFVITSQEVGELNGTALVAALRLSRSMNRYIKTIVLSSNRLQKLPAELQPDTVIKKDANLPRNIAESMKWLGLVRGE